MQSDLLVLRRMRNFYSTTRMAPYNLNLKKTILTYYFKFIEPMRIYVGNA